MRWLVLPAILTIPGLAAAQTPDNSCASGAHRSLDFLIGSWTIPGLSGGSGGSSTFESILDGCALTEEWAGTNGTHRSLNVFAWDRDAALWRYTSFDTFGSFLQLSGGWSGDTLRLSGDDAAGNSHVVLFVRQSDGTAGYRWDLRQRNRDWRTMFEGRYVRSARTP